MWTRRRAVALGVLTVSGLSGCGGAAELATGSGPIERTASPAILAEPAVSDTAYELSSREEQVLRREVSAGGETRTIVATNQIARYEKALNGVGRGSQFVVLSTPGFSFAGQPLNPIADWTNEELLQSVGPAFGDLSAVRERATRTEPMLGTDTTVSKFDATATAGGQAFDLSLYTASVVNEGDVVIGAGGYPQAVDSGEAGTVEGFFSAIDHPTDR